MNTPLTQTLAASVNTIRNTSPDTGGQDQARHIDSHDG